MGQASDSETFPLFFHLAENYKLELESLVAVAATRNKHDTMFTIFVVDAYLPIPTLFIMVILVFHLSFSNVSLGSMVDGIFDFLHLQNNFLCLLHIDKTS